jgi:hypothetical protein
MTTRRDDPRIVLQSIIKRSTANMKRSDAAKAMGCSKDFAWRVNRATEPPDRSISYYINALTALGHEVTLLVRTPKDDDEARLRVAEWIENDGK